MKKNETDDNALHFASVVTKAWTPEKLKKITGGSRYKVLPTNAPHLLRKLGLLNGDGSMSADSVRKFSQINHMLNLLEPALADIIKNIKTPVIVEAGCGKSYLSLVLMWAFDTIWNRPAYLVGIDTNPKVIEKSQATATALGWGSRSTFLAANLADDWWATSRDAIASTIGLAPEKCRPNVVLALHACDTATDHALAAGVNHNADLIACAPCCQAELAAKWRALGDGESSSLSPIYRSPELRRDVASDITDMYRVLLLRSRGYEVTATEFVPSEHTPKNRLIRAVRRGRYLVSAQKEYADMRHTFGDVGITLEGLLKTQETKTTESP